MLLFFNLYLLYLYIFFIKLSYLLINNKFNLNVSVTRYTNSHKNAYMYVSINLLTWLYTAGVKAEALKKLFTSMTHTTSHTQTVLRWMYFLHPMQHNNLDPNIFTQMLLLFTVHWNSFTRTRHKIKKYKKININNSHPLISNFLQV